MNDRINDDYQELPEVTVFLPFTRDNLESVLRGKYGPVEFTQTAFKKTCGRNEYSIFINIEGKETSEEIKNNLFRYFQLAPVGGNINFHSKDKPITLFLQYQNEKDKFNLKFNNISAPDLLAIVNRA